MDRLKVATAGLRALLERVLTYPVARSARIALAALLVVLVASSAVYLAAIPRLSTLPPTAEEGVFRNGDSVGGVDFDTATGRFVVSTKSGGRFTSNLLPEEAEADSIAKGLDRMGMMSQFVIRYVDKDGRISTATSFVNALDRNEKALDAVREGGAIRADYSFTTGKSTEGLSIVVPVEYRIEGGYVQVSVLADQIQENVGYRLLDISVLPYFGAGTAKEKGYLLIPDGSGALVDFQSTKTKNAGYEAPVYGRDPSLKTKQVVATTQTVRLPVFGIQKGDSAFLAIADQGDAMATVVATPPGIDSDYANAYFVFRYRNLDTITLNELGWNERSLTQVGATHVTTAVFRVRYYFLDGAEADYVGMAKVHREYLMARYGLEPLKPTGKVALFLDVQMSVRTMKTFAGFPVEGVEALTTFDQLKEMIAAFRAKGAEAVVARISGWTAGGPFGKLPSGTAADSALGGRSALKELLNDLPADGTEMLYLSTGFVNAYRPGNGFQPMLQGNRDITGALSLQYRFQPSTGVKDWRTPAWNLVTPGYSVALFERFLDGFAAFRRDGLGIAVDDYGSTVYSDTYDSFLNSLVGRVSSDRQAAERLWSYAMQKASATTGSLLVDGGNSYALASADVVVGIPMESSRFKAADREVPYYSMVMSGLVRTTSTPVNFSVDIDDFYLHCLETGTSPLYALFATDSAAVKDTRLNTLYNGDYRVWIDGAMERYAVYREAFATIEAQPVVSREEPSEGVVVVGFANGSRILVNHTDASVVLEGVAVGPASFALVGGGAHD